MSLGAVTRRALPRRAIFGTPSRWARARRRSELGLLIVASVMVLFAALLVSLALSDALPANALKIVLTMVGLTLGLQIVNRRLVPDADPVIMPVALALNGIGYVMIEALDPGHAGQQVAWMVLGLVAYTIVLAAVKRSRDLERYRYLILAAAFLMLVAPLFPVIGRSPANQNAYGAKLWVSFHSISFQPVEIGKLLLVLFFASYFVEKRELLTIPTRRVGDHLLPDLRAFGPIAVAWVLSLLVILAEHDIGFSLLVFAVFLTLLWITTGRWTYVLIGLVLFAAGAYFASHLLTQVNDRISIWLNPWSQAQSGGYQPIQGELAFGRGGLWGSGLGLGLVQINTPGNVVLPVATSDYIFAAIGEELGLVGTVALLVGYVLIVGSGLRAGLRARSEFAKLAAVGLTVTLGFQAFIIMAGVTRLLPDTGMTLPFVSYGGSSLVANYILLALLMRISNEGNHVPAAPPTPIWTTQ
ncbi:MAG TPA: FtsW/RodA/SpoVE family cell cycle protein [Acidimicrobiales bacterium]|nr:FtsW/RodA/SpoVE family cell cycle protein [Acidimicrobiales bacterium]